MREESKNSDTLSPESSSKYSAVEAEIDKLRMEITTYESLVSSLESILTPILVSEITGEARDNTVDSEPKTALSYVIREQKYELCSINTRLRHLIERIEI